MLLSRPGALLQTTVYGLALVTPMAFPLKYSTLRIDVRPGLTLEVNVTFWPGWIETALSDFPSTRSAFAERTTGD